ncbi:protein VAC14 homolog isoform X2 [Tribolium madens]|uniref:protein VAC14 homolog isoform X2 n=1 Tax=Tribolium madens TaxID=41895 RepID=UPI001CF7212C|nr:protein VAC14 homolog isoform X2 [Tribolium madens]
MSEKDYAPLSSACVRALHDKLYDKRKTAALEIEKMVKEFANLNNTSQIRRLLKVLGQDFASSQNPHARKGGLIGLAATAIALGKDTSNYTDELIKPILGCLSDQDLRVRYYACESLYNVVKVSRGAVLPHFSAIFNALSKIATDPDQHVKNASELLDRLLKDIVTESTNFDLEGFMPLLRERIYTKATFARQFVISWISVLDMVPDIDLLFYLPEILDGLFRILADTNLEVKKMCETTLNEFLRNIKSDPSKVNFPAMINILINHAQEKNDDLVQFTAITWIKEFVQLSGAAMLPYMSGIFTAVLPCLAYDTESRRNIKETATAVNFTLMKLIAVQGDDSGGRTTTGEANLSQLDLQSVVDVLTQYMMHNSIQTKVAVLKWIHDLYTKLPDEMVNHIDVLFPALQRTLADEADQVVQQCLVVIAEVISSPVTKKTSPDGGTMKHLGCETNPYYNKFLISLLQAFNTEKRLLDERGSFIIRQLCVLLNAEEIYRNLAHILLNEPNLKFTRLMVEHLNMILLTSSELYDMRNRLKELKTEESCSLFCCLYETWSYNPVATVALCLLTQSYAHVCDLIRLFGNLEVTVDFLMEIDKLVQLIESPIFAYLRLELLQVPCDKNLIQALYGLLMLLPQTDAFQTLKIRLGCIPSLHLHCDKATIQPNSTQEFKRNIDFAKLLQHFIEVQEKYKEYKKMMRLKDLTYAEKELGNLEL